MLDIDLIQKDRCCAVRAQVVLRSDEAAWLGEVEMLEEDFLS